MAIVDELPYGGTCALRGCDPKKILRRGAEIIDGARLMSGRGIDGLRINWPDLMQHLIVGAHMLGPEYGELINFCGLAIKLDLTTRQLKSMTAAYPTVTSDSML